MSLSAEQLASRRLSIGASDAAAALGLSPWKTPFRLWQEKMGLAESEPENEAMYWGSALESAILHRYLKDHPDPEYRAQVRCMHNGYTWMTATLDAVVNGRVIEIKTARSAEGWGEPGSAEIPQHYMTQVQHQMAVTRRPIANVPVLIGGSDYRLYEVPADKELQELIIEGESRFWHNHVLANVAPEPTTLDDCKLKYGRQSVAQTMDADDRLRAFYEELKQVNASIKEMEARADLAKLEIMKALGERDTLLVDGKVACTWKIAKAPMRFDSKAFEAAHPSLHKQFQKLGEPSRRLLIKDIK